MQNATELHKLHAAARTLLAQEQLSGAVERLRQELAASPEPFVWTSIALDTVDAELPQAIKSCWIFLLRRDTPSGCHYHPNSVQHMAAVNGGGRAEVGGESRAIVPVASEHHALEDRWFVIERNVPHEFFPEGEDMAVVSFHTCAASELEEVACDSGQSRRYQPGDGQP